MYAKRAFVHWYVGEGMEKENFLKPVRILLPLRKIMKRLVWILPREKVKMRAKSTNSPIKTLKRYC